MTDEEFIYEAKQKVLENMGEFVSYGAIHMTWYSYTLGNYKAMFMVEDMPEYFEVTYVKAEDKFEIDVYA